MGKEGSALATLATSLNAGPRSDQPGVRSKRRPSAAVPGCKQLLGFSRLPFPFSELGRHDGRGGRKLASKARRRRALTVVYPPRNKGPLTTSLLSNWPSTQSEGWRSGFICPLLEHRLTFRLVVLSAGVDRHALVASRRGKEPDASRFCVGRQQCPVLNHSDYGIAP